MKKAVAVVSHLDSDEDSDSDNDEFSEEIDDD